ncbi:FG-GAP repeat protein [Desulfococcaceae bacterium HSG7]|nr:FG-GAP repeat protein [Desulfococcaceae bacterium HSG7]
MEYRRGDVTEWYVNGPMGMQQGFTLEKRPELSNSKSRSDNKELLTLTLAVEGDWRTEVSEKGRDLNLTAVNGVSLRYGGLVAYDTSGKTLPARFGLSPQSQTVNILVDDSAAVYPLIIDPVIQQQFVKGDNIGDAVNGGGDNYFGYSVGIDGDTMIVGAYYEDGVGNAN